MDSEKVLDEASKIYAHLKRRGELLPDADILIAAIAKVYNLTLVTNDSHFERIEGLRKDVVKSTKNAGKVCKPLIFCDTDLVWIQNT